MPVGEYCLFEIDERGAWLPRFRGFRRNLMLLTWGHLAAQCLGRGDRNYRISTLYLEYENSSAVPVAVPDFTERDGIEYYDGLAASPNRDYVRVPIEATPAIAVARGYEDLLPPDRGNQVIFAAQTGATYGVHGKPFSAAASSVVFGVGVVATPVIADATADILLARGYYDPDDQIPKIARQLGVIYKVTFGEDRA